MDDMMVYLFCTFVRFCIIGKEAVVYVYCGARRSYGKKKALLFCALSFGASGDCSAAGDCGLWSLVYSFFGPSDYAGDMFAAAVEDVPFGDTVLRLFLSDAEIERAQTLNDQGNAGEQLFSVYP